jgi:hypothetical protein
MMNAARQQASQKPGEVRMNQLGSVESAAYIGDLCAELQRMAERANLATMACLLSMVCQEAKAMQKAALGVACNDARQ